jgi:hypothetical protein
VVGFSLPLSSHLNPAVISCATGVTVSVSVWEWKCPQCSLTTASPCGKGGVLGLLTRAIRDTESPAVLWCVVVCSQSAPGWENHGGLGRACTQ